MKKVPGKVPNKGEALGPQPVSNLDPTYHTPPKTKHTCELLAVGQVQAGERHVLEHLDVAWGNGVGRGRVRRNGEGSQESSLRAALGQHPRLILTPPTQPHLIHTPLTSEVLAVGDVQVCERHVLEALDVACVYMEK